jgi:hypothetical protein
VKTGIALALAVALLGAGCSLSADRPAGVYLLLGSVEPDTPGLNAAHAVVNYLLARLNPNDILAVASIDTENFSENDIIAMVCFDQRPSVSNNQKRSFQKQFQRFAAGSKPKALADLSGGILYAIEYLNTADPGKKVILILADFGLEPTHGHVPDAALQLAGFDVVAFDVGVPGTAVADPQRFHDRAEQWREKVENAGGRWRVVAHVEDLDAILAVN